MNVYMLKRFSAVVVLAASVGQSSAQELAIEQRRDIDEIWQGISKAVNAYDGSQRSFLAHFFTGELDEGIPLHDSLALPDIDDPLAWQANYRFINGSFGEGWLCTQFGVQTLKEIDTRANNGTPTNWRDTLLRENLDRGYIAKLNCEFRFLNVRYRDGGRDTVPKSLHDVFDEVQITSESKGVDDTRYTQHRVSARKGMRSNVTEISRLQLTINDLDGEDDNVRGRIIVLVIAPQS